MRKVLILTDGKAGHENQSKAFARALGCEFDLVEVHFKSKFHKALSYVFDRIGVRTLRLLNGEAAPSPLVQKSSVSFSPSGEGAASPYVAVLGTGSGTFYAAKAMAKKLGVNCGVVLYPRGYDIASFDCVLAPAFDRPKAAANVIEIPANLVANDEAFYEKGVAAFWEKRGKDFRRETGDAVAVIVGGPNKCSTMTADWMREQLAADFAAVGGMAVEVVSGSQRPEFIPMCMNWVERYGFVASSGSDFHSFSGTRPVPGSQGTLPKGVPTVLNLLGIC